MNTKSQARELRQIETDEMDIGHRMESVLRALGWVYSSAYPDCCWRWSKTFDGKSDDRKTAVRKTITDDTRGAYRLELSLLEDDGDE